jgi:hypothetical protein
MSPGMTVDTTLPGTTSALFNVPKLAEDGSNWITYKERTLTAISARGLMRYADGRALEPLPYPVDEKTGSLKPKADGSIPNEKEIEERDKKIDEYDQKNSLVKQQVFSTITDRLLLRVQKLESASEVWAEICQIHEDKTELVQIDLRRRLHETRCDEGGDVKAHFAEMLRLRESLAGMGAGILDPDFHAMILGSLPESYRPLLSSINAAAKITKTPLSPYELINIVTEEYEHRLLTEKRPGKKGGANSALSAREAKGKGRRSATSSKTNTDITCYNCDRKGHYKSNCWRPGGGKEGQGPNQQRKKGEKGHTETANSAVESAPQDQYAFTTSDLATIAKAIKVPAEKRGAIVDSGATSHFCPDRAKFTNYVDIPPQDVHTADGSSLSAVGRGDVELELPLGDKRTKVTLKDTLYAPTMAFTLISTNRITEAGMAVLF